MFGIIIMFLNMVSLWLAMHRKLQTRDTLYTLNINIDDVCFLCGDGREDHGHLFFGCSFSRQCIKEVKKWLDINTTSSNLDQILGGLKEDTREVRSRSKL